MQLSIKELWVFRPVLGAGFYLIVVMLFAWLVEKKEGVRGLVLGITLIVSALISIIYGLTKKNKSFVVGGVIGLIIIAILYLVYSYLYALNPY